MKYTFKYATHCNMCQASIENSAVLGKRLNQPQGFKPSGKTGITTTIVKCNNCGLVYANPMPIPENIGDHYDMASDAYHDHTLFEEIETTDDIEIYLKIRKDKGSERLKALEIGSGLGRTMGALEKQGFDAYGIEPSHSFFEYAVHKRGISEARIQCKPIEEAYFKDNFFDYIIFSNVLEHLYDPNAALVNTLEWLKPGGLIHIGVPSARALNQLVANFIYKFRGTDYVSNISPMHPPFHLYEFTKKAFEENAKINQYTIEFFEYSTYKTFFPAFLDGVIKPFMKFTDTGMALHFFLKKA